MIVNLNNFKIVDALEEGSFGPVLMIQENKTHRLFTAQISKSECKSKHDQKHFNQEIQSLLNISNPFILSIYGINSKNFRNEYFPTIITEYMPNGSLNKLITDNEDFPLSKKYLILLGIAEGMKYLHSQNIVHGNLNPTNILLDQDYCPYISDYGLYKITKKLESSISNIGSPIYMAPEVFSDSQYSNKSDVYSFSILAYELLTGSFPFQKVQTVYRLQRSIVKGKRPRISLILDETMQLLLTKCWAVEPENRPDFNEICETLKKENVMKSMNTNKNEVDTYLNSPKSRLPPLRLTSSPTKSATEDRKSVV